MSNLSNILGGQFNANEVAPQEDKGGEFTPIPNGYYVMCVTGAELNQGTGKSGLKMEYTILDGKYKDRKVWDYINLTNPNAKCVEIGLSQLSALCLAVNIPTPQDSSELLDKPFVGRVKMGKPSACGNYPAKEGVAAWLATNNAEAMGKVNDTEAKNQNPANTAPAVGNPAPAAAADSGKKPWEN